MSYLAEHFKVGMDPFHRGLCSAPQICLGLRMTRGLRFPISAGVLVLLRRRLYPDVGAWIFCGMAAPDATTIANWSGFPHAADEAFQYASVRALGNGFVSRLRQPVRVDFDDQGDLISAALPMFPLGIAAEPIAGGKFRVTWTYDTFGQGAPPADFQVFGGATPGAVNYGNPLTDLLTGLKYVSYLGDGRRHVFTTGAYGDGVARVFAVRARNSGQVAEQNTYTTESKTANAGAPTEAEAMDLRMRRK